MASAVAGMMDTLRERGGLKGVDVANIAAVSPATMSRWIAGSALPHPKTQLSISDLRSVVERLAEFYDAAETRSAHSAPASHRAPETKLRGVAEGGSIARVNKWVLAN